MGSNHRPTRRIPLCLSLCLTAMLLLVLLSPLLPLPRAVAQQPDGLLYASDFQKDEGTGWSLQSSQDGAWVVDAGALNGYGHVWAVYEKGFHWGESGIYTYRIRFAYLEGGLNVNLQVGETGRYAIELQDMDGRLHVGLLREYPSREFVEVIAPRDTGYALADRPDGFAVEVRAGENRIEVTLEGHDHNPTLTFKEPDPLPPGTLAFETYENSATQITKVEVWGPAQQPVALPDLGIADAAWRHDADSGLIELDLRVRNLGKGESGPTGVYAELMPRGDRYHGTAPRTGPRSGHGARDSVRAAPEPAWGSRHGVHRPRPRAARRGIQRGKQRHGATGKGRGARAHSHAPVAHRHTCATAPADTPAGRPG